MVTGQTVLRASARWASSFVDEARTLYVRASDEGAVFNPLTNALAQLGAGAEEETV